MLDTICIYRGDIDYALDVTFNFTYDQAFKEFDIYDLEATDTGGYFILTGEEEERIRDIIAERIQEGRYN